MVREITREMSGIDLRSVPPNAPQLREGRRTDAVHGLVDGEHPIQVQFRAEPRLFVRLARNMIGQDPEDGEEVREYATEYFNVLCGRFLSELYRMGNIRVHNMTIPRSEVFPNVTEMERENLHALHFISEEEEIVTFSWTAVPVEDMLRRNSNV